MIRRYWQLAHYIRHGWQLFVVIQLLCLLAILSLCWVNLSSELNSRLTIVADTTDHYYNTAITRLDQLASELSLNECSYDAEFRLNRAGLESNVFDHFAFLSDEAGYCRSQNNPLTPLFVGNLIQSGPGPIWFGRYQSEQLPFFVFVREFAPKQYLIGVSKLIYLENRLVSYRAKTVQAALSLDIDGRTLLAFNNLEGLPWFNIHRTFQFGHVTVDATYVPDLFQVVRPEWLSYSVPLALLISLSISGLMVYRRSHRGIYLADLDVAFQRKEIYPVFQPIVDASSNRPLGYEVMARWDHPVMGAISPNSFIPLMERFGRLDTLLTELVKQCQGQVPAGCYLSLNLSGEQLTQSFRDPIQFVQSLLSKLQIDANQLMIEITEREALDYENPKLIATLNRLREMGVTLAFDDFGTGHNGIGCLKAFAPDYIKIDKSYVHTLNGDAVQKPVLEAIIQLAKSMNIGIIAEGVETEGQRQFLLSRGVKRQQGYLLGRPGNLQTATAVEAR